MCTLKLFWATKPETPCGQQNHEDTFSKNTFTAWPPKIITYDYWRIRGYIVDNLNFVLKPMLIQSWKYIFRNYSREYKLLTILNRKERKREYNERWLTRRLSVSTTCVVEHSEGCVHHVERREITAKFLSFIYSMIKLIAWLLRFLFKSPDF